eukprot:2613251-Amphidinium_carterae.3
MASSALLVDSVFISQVSCCYTLPAPTPIRLVQHRMSGLLPPLALQELALQSGVWTASSAASSRLQAAADYLQVWFTVVQPAGEDPEDPTSLAPSPTFALWNSQSRFPVLCA